MASPEALVKVYLNRLTGVDREAAVKFTNDLEARNLAQKTFVRYLKEVVSFQQWLGRPLTEATADDLRTYVRHMFDRGLAPYTVRVATVILKLFLARWMGKEDVKAVKAPKAERPMPKPLTEEEIIRIIRVGTTPYEKAMIAILYEGGLRLGELEGIKIGDLEVDQYGIKVSVNGKSGERPVRLIHSAPYLQAFLEHHPFKTNPAARLFYGRSILEGRYRPDPDRPITHTGVSDILKRLARKAEINGKRIHPHLLRHTRATVLSKNLTDRELMQVFGWKTPSMVSVYSHLSMRDVEDKLLTLAGMKSKADEKPSPMTPKHCPRCKYLNPATSRFCSQCSMILDLDTAMQLEEARAKADNVMSKLLEDPETQRYLAAKIKELGIIAEKT